MAWSFSAITCAYSGNPDEAEERNLRYKRLSPFDPHAYFFDTAFIIIYLLKKQYEKAIEYGRSVTQLCPSFSAAYKPYLAALGHLGLEDEAVSIRRRLSALEPEFTVERFLQATPLVREGDRILYAEGLRLAGIRESDPPALNAPIKLRPNLG